MIQPNIHRISRKVNQIIYIMYLNCKIDDIILVQAVLQIFCCQDCFILRNAKVGISQIFIEFCQKLIRSSTAHLGHNLCVKYHDPSSSGSPDLYLYTLDTIYVSNMILAQAVLQTFC